MGGLRVTPDIIVDELDPAASDVLILPGSEMWDTGGGGAFATAAVRFLDASVPVAAICGATIGLARAGLVNDRRHTSSSADYLAATGYKGAALYVDERATIDRDLIPAGPQSPAQFTRDDATPATRLRTHARGLREPLLSRRPRRLPPSSCRPRRTRDRARGGVLR
jgi:putative intracellular protease/amidase